MKIFLTDQKNNFDSLLLELMTRPVMAYDRARLIEQTTTIELKTKTHLDQLDLSCLFDYRIFPPHIMTHRTQWAQERRNMQIGDTILQQVFIPPIPSFSQKLIFGVRIKDIIDEKTRRGFSYETLKGHVEKGISYFTVEQTDDGLIFKIHTFSEPRNFLLKIAGPFFGLPYQAYCTRQALSHVKHELEP